MAMGERDRMLANLERRGDGFVPCDLFNGYAEDWCSIERKGEEGNTTMDAWGSMWESRHPGLRGEVTRPALADVSEIEAYEPPDLLAVDDFGSPLDWDVIMKDVQEQRRQGRLVEGRGGRLYDRTHFLLGFEEFLVNVGLEVGDLLRVYEMVAAQNLRLVRRWIAIGVDLMSFMDDLGMQDRLQVHPDTFRRLFLPAYAKLYGVCRDAGVHVRMHTNGHVVPLIRDLIDVGVTVLSLEDGVNSIDEMAREIDGKAALRLNLDVQRLIRFGSPKEIDRHVRNCVKCLGSPTGGLHLVARIAPATPAVNIEAVRAAFAMYQNMWVGNE